VVVIAGNEAPSRRAIFGLVASVGAAAVVGPIAAAALVADTSAWDSAMGELVRAEAAYEADKHTFDPLVARWRAGRPDEDMVDWSALLDGRRSAFGSYDLDAAETATRRQIERGYFRGRHLEELSRRRLAAYDQVRAFRIAEDANDERHDYRLASDRNAKLSQTVSDLEDVLIAMPAPHAAALSWKIGRLITDDNGTVPPWSFSYVQPMLQDVRRLIGGDA
jgi:hypothetical protein